MLAVGGYDRSICRVYQAHSYSLVELRELMELVVRRATRSEVDWLAQQLRREVIRHFLAVFSLKAGRGEVYTATRGGELVGYALVEHGGSQPFIHIEGAPEALKVLDRLPWRNLIAYTSPHLARMLQRRHRVTRVHTDIWMVVERGRARFYRSRLVRRLEPADAEALLELLQTREDRAAPSLEELRSKLRENPAYGVILGGRVVSHACSTRRLKEAWMVEEVYTHPDYRNRGYATLATSALTEEALKSTQKAVLFTREDNHPAIRVYTKIGYRKTLEKKQLHITRQLRG